MLARVQEPELTLTWLEDTMVVMAIVELPESFCELLEPPFFLTPLLLGKKEGMRMGTCDSNPGRKHPLPDNLDPLSS